MAEKIKKTLPWFLILVLIGLTVGIALNFGEVEVKADSAGTSVTVGNAAPDWTVVPADSSDGTTPTNVGSNVTFTATASDPNSDNYYLAICKTNAITAVNSGPPTCPGDPWAVSTSTADDAEASVTYTALVGDAQSNIWYGFVCDHNAASACSAVSNAASPFKVNHVPGFTVYADDAPVNPAATVTWTTTASDTDDDTAQDTVTLYVCKTNSFTAPSTCNGGEWCHSSASASNPTCNTTSLRPDGDYDAYGYVVDSHGFAASAGSQGTDSILTVSNIAPTITAATIDLQDTDAAGSLTLLNEEAETESFKVVFTVVDNNSCENLSAGNEIASALIHVYRSGVTQASCDGDDVDNANNCYQNAQTTDAQGCTQTGSCGGTTDTDIEWTCEFGLQYHADPTVADTEYPDDNWLVSVKATDDNSSASSLTEDTTGNELDTFAMYDVDNGSASIAYGNPLAPEATSADQTNTVEATGNVGLDTTLYGANMTSNGYTIAVGQQHYNTADIAWASMTALLVESGAELELNVGKTTTTETPASADIHWKLKIPADQESATYSGTNTIVGIVGESAGW